MTELIADINIMTCILLLIVQYAVVLKLYINNNKFYLDTGIILWVPILGPISVLATLLLIVVISFPFLIPLAIGNTIILFTRKVTGKDIEYL